MQKQDQDYYNKLNKDLEDKTCPKCGSRHININRWNLFIGEDDWFYSCIKCKNIFRY